MNILSWFLNKTKLVLSVSLMMMISRIFMFNSFGGEFIPNLDEGDVALHALLKPGSSLEESIKATTEIEKDLFNNYP